MRNETPVYLQDQRYILLLKNISLGRDFNPAGRLFLNELAREKFPSHSYVFGLIKCYSARAPCITRMPVDCDWEVHRGIFLARMRGDSDLEAIRRETEYFQSARHGAKCGTDFSLGRISVLEDIRYIWETMFDQSKKSKKPILEKLLLATTAMRFEIYSCLISRVYCSVPLGAKEKRILGMLVVSLHQKK